MRAANYTSMNIFNESDIKEINKVINQNLISGKDNYAQES